MQIDLRYEPAVRHLVPAPHFGEFRGNPAEPIDDIGKSRIVLVCRHLRAPRSVGRFGARAVLPVALLVQGGFTAAVAALNFSDGVLLLLVAGTIACFGHMHAIVSYGIAATSGLSDNEQGLATGLVTTAQQVGITVGIPLLAALASARTAHLRAVGHSFGMATLGGVRLGLAADALVLLLVGISILAFLRVRPDPVR